MGGRWNWFRIMLLAVLNHRHLLCIRPQSFILVARRALNKDICFGFIGAWKCLRTSKKITLPGRRSFCTFTTLSSWSVAVLNTATAATTHDDNLHPVSCCCLKQKHKSWFCRNGRRQGCFHKHRSHYSHEIHKLQLWRYVKKIDIFQSPHNLVIRNSYTCMLAACNNFEKKQINEINDQCADSDRN